MDNASSNHIRIRGRTLPLDALVDSRIHDPDFRDAQRLAFEQAKPFPHLRMDRLFHPTLLELVREEFDLYPARGWRGFTTPQEQTFRSQPGTRLGPASRVYFNLVNGYDFVEFLGAITGVPHLIVDRTLFGGGLHESRNGGKFGVHLDFDRHAETGLRNEMVFLTYLNPSWNPKWGGALELWDAQKGQAVVQVQPEFGTSLLMRHRHDSFHGHPEPMHLPEGVQRRSLAAYYYSNPLREQASAAARTTTFMQQPRRYAMHMAMLRTARRWMPPVLWDWARSLRRRSRAA